MSLSGFSLFRTGKDRWQFSYRTEGETGWSVHVGYPDAKAQEILKLVGDLIPKTPEAAPEPAVQDGRLNLRPQRRQRVMI